MNWGPISGVFRYLLFHILSFARQILTLSTKMNGQQIAWPQYFRLPCLCGNTRSLP